MRLISTFAAALAMTGLLVTTPAPAQTELQYLQVLKACLAKAKSGVQRSRCYWRHWEERTRRGP